MRSVFAERILFMLYCLYNVSRPYYNGADVKVYTGEKNNYTDNAMFDRYRLSSWYYSEFGMGQHEFYDFSSVSYVRISIFYILFFILSLLCYLSHIFEGNYSSITTYSGVILFVFIMRYIFSGFAIKAKYQQAVLAAGGIAQIYRVYFSSMITVIYDDSTPAEYNYSDINKFYETSRFFLLRMKNKQYILVDKLSLPQGKEKEFIKFILSKCDDIKKKHTVKISGKKRICLILTIITAIIFLSSILLSVINTVYPLPSLF